MDGQATLPNTLSVCALAFPPLCAQEVSCQFSRACVRGGGLGQKSVNNINRGVNSFDTYASVLVSLVGVGGCWNVVNDLKWGGGGSGGTVAPPPLLRLPAHDGQHLGQLPGQLVLRGELVLLQSLDQLQERDRSLNEQHSK